MVHGRALFLFVLSCQLSLVAQMQTGNVHIYVTYADDRAPTLQMKVALISGSNGNQIFETFTNDHGEAQFVGVTLGNYRVSVSGEGIVSTESDEFEVDARKNSQSIFVRVRTVKNDGPLGANTVSANDLRIPKDASKEFDKATQLISEQRWDKAIEHLNTAIALYPNYARAYTNLGVVYARTGDPESERQALLQAIKADDHFAPALTNLARLEMRLHNFSAAEADLRKASAIAPLDTPSMVLLAQAELLNLHYEDAIAVATKVHGTLPGSHALIHYIAARACESLRRFPEAIAQLKFFLLEEPSGTFSSSAKKELADLEKLPIPPS